MVAIGMFTVPGNGKNIITERMKLINALMMGSLNFAFTLRPYRVLSAN
jgi:hypothetical protein